MAHPTRRMRSPASRRTFTLLPNKLASSKVNFASSTIAMFFKLSENNVVKAMVLLAWSKPATS